MTLSVRAWYLFLCCPRRVVTNRHEAHLSVYMGLMYKQTSLNKFDFYHRRGPNVLSTSLRTLDLGRSYLDVAVPPHAPQLAPLTRS